MNPMTIIPEEAVKALGWTLVHSIWQGALIVLLLVVLMNVLKQSSSRYLASLLGLLGLLVAFASTFFLEFQHFLLESRSIPFSETEATISEGIVADLSTSKGGILAFLTDSILEWKVSLDSYLPILVALWGLGVIAYTTRLAGGLLYLFRLRKASDFGLPAEYVEKFEGLKAKMGIRRRIKWIGSRNIDEPLTIFHLKPIIFFPLALLSGLSPDQVEAIILHELAHIRRADYLVNVVQTIIEIILFYHPAVWWISGRIRQERESCCDDLVMACGMDPFSYAEALTQVQSFNQSTKPMLSMSALGKSGNFTSRIQRLFGHNPKQSFRSKSLIAAGILVVSLTTLAFQQPNPVSNDLVMLQSETNTIKELAEPETKAAFEIIEAEPVEKLAPQGPDKSVNIVITSYTTEAELKAIKKQMAKRGINIEYSNIERNAEGKLSSISGSIEFPDGSKGGFSGNGEENMRLTIARPYEKGEWGGLQVQVYNGALSSETQDPGKEEIIEEKASAISIRELGDAKKPLFILDGEVLGKDVNLDDIDPEEIATINIYKDESASEKYGTKGSDGVVEIVTKAQISIEEVEEKDSENEFIFEKKEKDSPENEFIIKDKGNSFKVRIRENKESNSDNTQPIYILDGKVVEKDMLSVIMPEEIKTVTVYKGDKAFDKYGEDAKNGVVVIHTKENENSFVEKDIVELETPLKTMNVNVFPNSFNDDLHIEFELNQPGDITISVFDPSGRKVEEIASKRYPKGSHVIDWEGSKLSSGVYTIQIKNGEETINKRIIKE